MTPVKEGVLSFAELQEIVSDWLSDHIPNAKGRVLSLEWVVRGDEEGKASISVHYVTRQLAEPEEDSQTLLLAAEALKASPELCRLAKSGDKRAVNTLVGIVMNATMKDSIPNPEAAFEMVANLLDLKFV